MNRLAVVALLLLPSLALGQSLDAQLDALTAKLADVEARSRALLKLTQEARPAHVVPPVKTFELELKPVETASGKKPVAVAQTPEIDAMKKQLEELRGAEKKLLAEKAAQDAKPKPAPSPAPAQPATEPAPAPVKSSGETPPVSAVSLPTTEGPAEPNPLTLPATILGGGGALAGLAGYLALRKKPTKESPMPPSTKICAPCGKHVTMIRKPKPPGTKGFDNPATQVGNSKWTGSDGKPVGVWYDPALGSNGQALATDVLSRIDDLMAYCDWVFATRGQGGNAIIIPGSNGAYHMGCDFANGGDWYEDDMGASPTPASQPGGLVFGLVMAEVVESYMGVQGKGWNCGGSGGEALSRILAETVSGGINGAMSGGFSARSSWSGADWITRDQGSDQDYDSIGCGMLYLDWMRSQGYTLDKIVQAGESDGTLAGNYATLTGKPASQAFTDFQVAVSKVNIQAANPFNIQDSPYPLPGPNPTPPPAPTPTPTPVPTPGPTPAGAITLPDIAAGVYMPVGASSSQALAAAGITLDQAVVLGTELATFLKELGLPLTFPAARMFRGK